MFTILIAEWDLLVQSGGVALLFPFQHIATAEGVNRKVKWKAAAFIGLYPPVSSRPGAHMLHAD